MTRDTAFLSEIVSIGFHPQEVSLVSFTLHLTAFTRKQLYRRLQQAYAPGHMKVDTFGKSDLLTLVAMKLD